MFPSGNWSDPFDMRDTIPSGEGHKMDRVGKYCAGCKDHRGNWNEAVSKHFATREMAVEHVLKLSKKYPFHTFEVWMVKDFPHEFQCTAANGRLIWNPNFKRPYDDR